MTPGAAVHGPSIRAHESIEVAARIMATENAEAANVTNAKGQVLGTITQSAVVEAMVPPAEAAGATAA